jgi:uncharacterized FlaG/YvyC family protein
MRLHGVDPNVVERVREQVTQPVVRELKGTRKINEDYREQGQAQQEEAGLSESLGRALDRLNQVCRTMGNPVSFRLVERDSEAKVEVYDGQENRVIREVNPEEVVHVVTQVEKLLGLLIDAHV